MLVGSPPSNLHIKNHAGTYVTDIQDLSDGTHGDFEGLGGFNRTKHCFSIVQREHQGLEYLHFFTFITVLFGLRGAILPWWTCPR